MGTGVDSADQLLKTKHEQEAQLKEIFDLFDTDGGGTIDRQEVSVTLVMDIFHLIFSVESVKNSVFAKIYSDV